MKKEAAGIVRNTPDRRRELTPVYAEFGATIHQAQILEDALRLLLLAGREYAKTQIPEEAIRYPAAPEGKKTLGVLLKEVKSVEPLFEDDQRLLSAAVSLRNYLVHTYWDKDDRALKMFTPEGREALVEELKAFGKFLRGVTGLVHTLIDGYLAAHGTSIKKFMDRADALYVSDDDLRDYEGMIN